MNDKLLIDRATIAQALEAFRMCVPMDGKHAEVDAAFRNLRAALARQAEPVAAVAENATAQQRVVETPPSDYRRGYWDGFNIGKREGRIEAEDALAQQPEPAQEPVAWIQPDHLQKARVAPFLCRVEPTQRCADFVAIYTTPPQRPSLTDEEITDAVREADLDWQAGWTLDEHEPNRFTTLARAIERKVRGEKE